ncbi:UTP--glucose-1-phosphate uridylyltransferase/phosphoglucomutase [Verrucomicrobium sp. GAS474]|uniref:UTP--glucose-1-phosphate uridylyltransferase n=1 Tax=Verrucomicrobium sp. GAS474 TaxID=1882831 RepID=UPI00087C5372|nr:UTP--glucose-1-phosphate uridylyltransferase [Verrucomicrobium sp. GAS474]SDU10022.1 UTP--glucose-1-phosphate uridylyltransferase/phosphoglucomutase [Verrucomicrobium sp. GAS474]
MTSAPEGTAPPSFQSFADKMAAAGISPAAIAAFERSFHQLSSGETGKIAEASIEAVASLPVVGTQGPGAKRTKKLLSHTCLLKLNGGLGTSMGMNGAKSLLTLKDGLSFLDLICRQVLHLREVHGPIEFLLMDSFTTSEETRNLIARCYPSLGTDADWEMIQNKVPKVLAETLAPASWPAEPELEWCPPGHGDLYSVLVGGGKLDALLAREIRYLFVSNSDNLGATLDTAILDQFSSLGCPFMMEVTHRTHADKKGGHLCRDKESGHLRLRESAQCPAEDMDTFQNIERHRYFNTNNLWINLHQLKKELDRQNGVIPLPAIFNAKTLDPRDKNTPKVIQLETAMGAAIESFPGAMAIEVPRTRFLPVKTTNDLLGLRSDAYEVTPDASLRLRADRKEISGSEEGPFIELDPAHYRFTDQLTDLFGSRAPSLKKCRSLRVQGLLRFSQGIEIVGDVTFVNASGEEKTVPPGTYADGTIEF